ncbi:layilin isoform X1 [Gadus macrocephalus]|uniref:layilin isoform X1 n=1 Tax=Gadus macrocephalus TaxID=80720 RepID=UPI0028CB3E64|nr:layilin isoform X1 [Gadus macrocephalus]
MERLIIFCHLLLFHVLPSTATNLITVDLYEARGQRVCRVGRERPCYKLAYFSDPRRRLNFVEAEQACRRDGGELLGVESASEQQVIEQLISEIRPTDGDFWIGLRRNHGDQESSLDCSSLYYWVDGSKATYRNWHTDEPSCGYEVCVVMYHQPSAPPSMGGLYMFQWNDDNCETRNNFICKYTAEKTLEAAAPPNSTQTDGLLTSALPWDPADRNKSKDTGLNWIYITLPVIPLLLLLLTLLAVCCLKLCIGRRRRRRQKSVVCHTEPGLCPGATSTDVYNVIRSQKEDDLSTTRPQTKNTSFLCSSPDTPTGDYDNMGGRDTESGFVTLASTESGFLHYDLNNLSLGRRGTTDMYDSSSGRSGKTEGFDRSLGRSTKTEGFDHSLGRSGKTEGFDRSLGRPTKTEGFDRSLGRSTKTEGFDRSLGRSTKTEGFDRSLGPSTKTEGFDRSLGRSTKTEGFDRSLEQSGKRDSYDTGLWRSDNQEFYNRAPGRRATKSEFYGSGSFVEQEMYGFRREKSDLYDPSLGPEANMIKADLYQTYMTNGKEGSYQTRLGNYGSQNPYPTNIDCYRSDLGFTGSRRYFNEAQWVNSEGY